MRVFSVHRSRVRVGVVSMSASTFTWRVPSFVFAIVAT